MAGRYWLGQTLVSDLVDSCGASSARRPARRAHQPPGLTPREREVLALVVAGCANKEIATFAVSEETVKHHLTRMFDKVGASNRRGAGDDRDTQRARQLSRVASPKKRSNQVRPPPPA